MTTTSVIAVLASVLFASVASAQDGHPLHKMYDGRPDDQLIHEVLTILLSGKD